MVPKDTAANLRFRSELIRLGSESHEAAHELWIMCKRDPLFYINSFAWTHSPKDFPDCPEQPFITWPCQDEAFGQIYEAIGSHDLLIEKSRDMGASWLILLAMEHKWHFLSWQSFLLVSRKEEYVDKAGDMKSLFAKLDFLHHRLPGWLMPNVDRKKLHLKNLDTGSMFDGESTNGDVGRGDRRTAVMADEFASVDNQKTVIQSLRANTNCIIFNSTPQGRNNEFYRRAQNRHTRKVRLHWSQHPIKAAGLYYDSLGHPRSPWYDKLCEEEPPFVVRQEYDIDYLGSDVMYFDPIVLEDMIQNDVRPAVEAELDYDLETFEPVGFSVREGGAWKLWIPLDEFGRTTQRDAFGVAGDVSAGTGSSNSTIAVVNLVTGEKVASFSSPRIDPTRLGHMMMAAGRFFRSETNEPAILCWEANGPGRHCGQAIEEAQYPNVYWREAAMSGGTAKRFPGWWNSDDEKNKAFNNYRLDIKAKKFINRDEEAIRECWDYVYQVGKGPINKQSVETDDPSGARDNHGDRVISDILANLLRREYGTTAKEVETERDDTFYARLKLNLLHDRRRRRRKQADGWVMKKW